MGGMIYVDLHLEGLLVIFLITGTKIPDINNGREERAILAHGFKGSQSIMVGKAWQRSSMMAGSCARVLDMVVSPANKYSLQAHPYWATSTRLGPGSICTTTHQKRFKHMNLWGTFYSQTKSESFV